MQKILIVEDDLAIQALLHDFIQEAGYSVELPYPASDGAENASEHFVTSFLVFWHRKGGASFRSAARVSLHTILFHRHDSLNMDN